MYRATSKGKIRTSMETTCPGTVKTRAMVALLKPFVVGPFVGKDILDAICVTLSIPPAPGSAPGPDEVRLLDYFH